MKSVNDIREEFLSFFESKGHARVPSAPLVPQNDPTLMFVNSGMVPFKNVFTGAESRDYSRATSSQKSVRAGGKHNDLENVGYTARHHTFFEMIGNFSFGDYFKEDAIAFAWEVVSKNFELDPEKLCVTIYHTDDEAFDIWKKVAGLHDDRIIRIKTDDNFWRMADTGPCGPSSEIFYDHGDHIPGGPPGSPDEDGDRFIEIWNLVFMQYEQIDAETRVDLPKPCIDTGMGLERMAATMMGSHDNYAIDVMRAIIDHAGDVTGVNPDGDQSASHRVIADHLRAASFLIADGVMPSNEGRGYVLRRIMRRGMRHAHLLGAADPLMHQLFPTLLNQMGEAYSELGAAEALIVETLRGEEERFKRTLERGLKLLDEEMADLEEGESLAGSTAFKLYDTFGFPLDLTQDALRARGIGVDTDGFDAAMAEQKAKARAAWSGSGDAADESVWFEILDEAGSTEFLGYESLQAEGLVQAIVKDGARVNELKAGEEGFVVTNQTPFYGESGGQVGDQGLFKSEDAAARVTDTKKKLGSLFIHCVQVSDGTLSIGDAVEMRVDADRRADIQANHSATHLLHEALRAVLGDSVTQKGSLQDAARTRFDISYNKAITGEEIARVEAIVNEQIAANADVVTRLMPIEEARETGAMALFGEKYDDEVRVVFMGTQGTEKQFSVELCGGTHVKSTGEIGRFKIVSDGAVSAGVRRVEALTGGRVDAYEADQNAKAQAALDKVVGDNARLRAELEALGGALDGDAPTSLEALQKDNRRLDKEIADLRRQNAAADGGDEAFKDIGGIAFAGKVLDGFPAKDLKPLADDMKAKLGSGVVVLIATDSGKASIVVGVTDDLTDRFSAVDLVRAGSAALGGKGGGGRPDMAQAGGPDGGAADAAVAAIEKALAS